MKLTLVKTADRGKLSALVFIDCNGLVQLATIAADGMRLEIKELAGVEKVEDLWISDDGTIRVLTIDGSVRSYSEEMEQWALDFTISGKGEDMFTHILPLSTPSFYLAVSYSYSTHSSTLYLVDQSTNTSTPVYTLEGNEYPLKTLCKLDADTNRVLLVKHMKEVCLFDVDISKRTGRMDRVIQVGNSELCGVERLEDGRIVVFGEECLKVLDFRASEEMGG